MPLLSGVARAAFKLCAERLERGFALVLDRGGMRRAWLRGRENVQKRYLIHVAGHNQGLIMRLLTEAETPRELQGRVAARLCVVITPNDGLTMLFVVEIGDQTAVLFVTLQSDPFG